MILGCHHVAISTPNLERSCAFYSDLLGFSVIKEMGYGRSGTPKPHLQSDDGAVQAALLKLGHIYLEILEYSYPVPKLQDPDHGVVDHGIAHLCFQIKNLKSEYTRLSEAGMVFHSPPLEVPGCESLFVYGRDPDGNVIEFIDFGEGDEFPKVYE